MEIKFVEKIPKYIDELLEKEYEIYESQKGIDSNFKYFYILAEENEKIVGILTGYTIFSEVCVTELLVVQGHRRQGIGSKLLSCLEEYFCDKDFTNINLVTNQFQAPEFYKKCEYSLEFIRKNEKFPSFSKYFFIKWFKQEKSSSEQGNIKNAQK